MLLSEAPYLEFIANIYATIFIGFGVLYYVNKPLAFSFFEITYPGEKSAKKSDAAVQADFKQAMDVIAIAYGVRDIYMGVAMYATAFCGSRQALGWITVAGGCAAAMDGVACKLIVGKGHMNHWSYAPVLLVLGGVMLGAFDWIPLEQIWMN